MPYLSIIIPCYNVAEYVSKTLNSLSQLKKADDCEFIFINDGATDNTLSYIQEFAKKDNRAIVIDQSNQGVSAARNAALKIATGKYILYLDGDDFLHPETVSIIQQFIHHADALLVPCIIVSEDNATMEQTLSIPQGIYSIKQLYSNCSVFPTAPMIVYRNSVIQNNDIMFDSTIKSGEVYTFTVDFFQHASTISVAHRGFYHYVMRHSSATHLPNYTADLSVLNILNHFATIHQSWTKQTAFKLTALKMILSFTYNKYVRHGLVDNKTINAIETLFSNNNFIQLLNTISLKKVDFIYRIFLSYLKIMPPQMGYLLCAYTQKLIKFIKYVAQFKKKM